MNHSADEPVTCLTVPGLMGSGPEHWQTRWEAVRGDCVRAELGCWSSPVRSLWVNRLDRTVRATRAPVVIVAHSLGCLATIWWAALAAPAIDGRVRGALLVAPPDVEDETHDRLLQRFAPAPDYRLPFPALLVASRNDPYASFDRQQHMARKWGCGLVDVGNLGHINADSGLDDWPEGQLLLDRMAQSQCAPAAAGLPDHVTLLIDEPRARSGTP